MRTTLALIGTLLTFVPAGLAFAPSNAEARSGPPTKWQLEQNDPDPFCASAPAGGATSIRFHAPETAHFELTVLDPLGGGVIRTLVDGLGLAGTYSILWDGTTDVGAPLPDGSYAYRFVATAIPERAEREDGGPAVLFEDIKSATISCATPHDHVDWSRIKARFR